MSAPSRRSPVVTIASLIVVAGILAGCSVSDGMSAAPTPAPDASDTRPAAAAPTATPSAVPVSETPEVVLEGIQVGQTAPYERTWDPSVWPAVPVPSAPTPRLTTSCADLATTAGVASAVRPSAPPATISALTIRQAGATLCAFTIPQSGTPVTIEMVISADTGAVGRDQAVRCSYTSAVAAATSCSGNTDVADGSVTVAASLPASTQPEPVRRTTQALLDAGRRAMENSPSLRPAPTAPQSALGTSTRECALSAEQTTAVFGQVDSDEVRRDAYAVAVPRRTSSEQALQSRVGTFGCWWWLGWVGISTSVVPGAGWLASDPGSVGTPVSVDGADAAWRAERSVTSGVSYGDQPPAELLEITLTTSARGSAVVSSVATDPAFADYWRERVIAATEAFIGTQP